MSALAAVGPYWNWSRLREKLRLETFQSYSARVVPATRQPLSVIRDGRASGSNGRPVIWTLPSTFHMPGRGAKPTGLRGNQLELVQIKAFLSRFSSQIIDKEADRLFRIEKLRFARSWPSGLTSRCEASGIPHRTNCC